MISRRAFLTTGATAAAAALTPATLIAALEKRSAPSPDLSTWSAVRAQFALKPGQLHFASFFLSSHPRPVRDAIEAFRRTLDEEPFLDVEHRMFADPVDNLQLRIRQDLSTYLGARPEEIALTGNTTTSLALVYAGLPLRPGDEILTTTHDHYSHHESIRFAVEKAGAKFRKVPLYTDPARATAGEVTDALKAALRSSTRAVGVTWVHSNTGVRLPIRALADVVRDANRGRDAADHVLLVVDGVHGLGAVDEIVGEMGCDFLAAGTHKWMFAPRGTGILWGRADRWARLRPTIPTFASLEAWNAWLNDDTTRRPTTAFDVSPGGFRAFEHEWAMSAAFRFHERIGRTRVAERIRELNDRCKAGLAGMRRITLHTPRDPAMSAGLIAFDVEGVSAEEVAKKLLARNIVASASPYQPSHARLAPSLVNDPNEVDVALRAVREIAGA